MTVDEKDCVVCRTQRGERPPDKEEHVTETIMGKEMPLVKMDVTVDYIADTSANGCPGCLDWSDTYDFVNNDNKYQPTHIPASVMSGGVYVGSIKITVNTAGKTINGVMNELMGGATQDNFTSFNGSLAP